MTTTYLSKVKNNLKFEGLKDSGKLLMYTLMLDPHLNTVGVLILKPLEICNSLNWGTDKLREAVLELRENKFIKTVTVGKTLYVILEGYATKKPTTDTKIYKYTEALSQLPPEVVEGVGIIFTRNSRKFTIPTTKEVLDYSISQGYLIEAVEFINYYNEVSKDMGAAEGTWFDKRGKEIKDWKGKLRQVWFRPNRKITPAKGAPEGFEFFYILYEGQPVFPDFWKGGLPKSKQFYLNSALENEYKKRTGNS